MFPGESPGWSRLEQLGRRRGVDRVFRDGRRWFVTKVNHFYNGEHALSVYVADTGSTGTSFSDTDVTTETLHVYRVKAINAAGVKPGSNYVRVKPSAANPTTTLSRHKRLGPPDAGRPKA